MSQMATEIRGAEQLVTTSEFLGSTFAERRQALKDVEAFKQVAQLALADSVSAMVGQEVTMTFRPARTTARDWNAWVPCYSLSDIVREPVTRNVTIRSVEDAKMQVLVTQGEMYKGTADASWLVRLDNIVSIEPIVEQEQSVITE